MKSRIIVAVASVALLVPLAAQAQHAQHYVLDAFGGVHAGGGAPIISPGTPYFGFDVAADIEYIPVGTLAATGDGILVLDKFGGVHKGGALAAHPPSGSTPYFGFDAARAIVYRNVPPRATGSATTQSTQVTSAAFVVLRTVSIRAPDDGFLLVAGSTNVFCYGAGSVRAEAGIDVDGAGRLDGYFFDVASCAVGLVDVNSNIGITKLFPVSAGNHTVNLLGRRSAGTLPAYFDGSSITALFIDQDEFGLSMPAVSAGAEAAAPGRPERRRR